MLWSSRSSEPAVSLTFAAVLLVGLSARTSFAQSVAVPDHHHHEPASATASTTASTSTAPAGALATAGDAAVTFVCCQYNPTTVTINVGETVSWSGSFSFHPLRQVAGPTSNVPVAGGFANGTGTFYMFQFNAAGTFHYQCAVHGTGAGGMRGEVIVLAPTDVASADDIASTTLVIEPNPTLKDARVRFTLPRAMNVELALYDLSGALVRRLARGPQTAGANQADWDGRDAQGRPAPAGLYFVRLSADRTLRQQKLVKVR